MSKKKILITGGKGMLAYDFIRTQSKFFDIIPVDREECDITSFESVMQCIALHSPDVVLNCAAYTAVDDAEDIGMKTCFDVNTLGVRNLAKATSVFDVEFITISTDYVFDGIQKEGYLPTDSSNPINSYGMAKYLGERLALDENPRTIIVRTSWLYGGNPYGSSEGVFKNFVNTMLRLSETHDELRVVSDQYGIPTSCIDLSYALTELINDGEMKEYAGQILHLTNSYQIENLSWAEFAREIFRISGKRIVVTGCTSAEYPTKAKRPKFSILKNNSGIIFPDWKESVKSFISKP